MLHLIQIRIKGKNNIIGTTPTEEIAKKVANFVYDNEKDENVIINAKKLCAKLKDENGELRRRVPAGYYSNPDNIKKELIRIKPKSLSDWPKSKRVKFSNDESNLFAVKKSVNRQKSAMGPAMWLPPNDNFKCEYIKLFQGIVTKYDLRQAVDELSEIDIKMDKFCVN